MATKTEPTTIALIALNRRASFDYELEAKYEAGIALGGSEVKMLRNGKADLTDTWVEVARHQAWLRGLSIPVLEHSPFSHEPKRSRKLLLHKNQIEQIARSVDRDGMTVVATRLFQRSLVKVEIAVAQGKKKGDKRETMKEKTAEKEARAAMARGRRGGA